ncbi:MAG: DUF5654 family protein [Patescibacteria group bacterium]|jgi:xanthine/uracil permease
MVINIDKIKEDSSVLRNEAREKTVGYIIAALSLVAGLAWSDVVKTVIEYFFPVSQSGIWLRAIYAIAITLLVVFVSFYLTKITSKK